jgi:hypothetical protein
MENKELSTRRRRGPRPDMPFDDEAGENSAPRPEMRSSMSGSESLERAKRRTAELLGHLGTQDEGTDEFYIDPNIVPEGWSYEWKRKMLLGAEDPSYWVHLTRMGWEPVPVNRDAGHAAMMPANWPGATIERRGMILMERPAEVVEEARRIEQKRAKDQVRAKEAQLAGTPEGTLTRDHEKARPSIKKSFEAIPIPKE